ncbi:MAG: hypothetical protein QHH80_11600 [Anaerolineae bacterium]|nr:hypothetical protein [Anaerolineae bacterium]
MTQAERRISYARAVCEVLRRADAPLPFADVLAAVAEMPVRPVPKPVRTVRNALRNSPLVVPVDCDRYAWSLWFLKGATVRHVLSQRELDEGSLRLGPDACYALFPFLYAPRHAAARPCYLYLEQGPLFSQPILWFDEGAAGIAPSYALSDWFAAMECREGDSLLFEVTDGEEGIYHVFLEPSDSRDMERTAARNAQVAQAVAQLLSGRRKPFPLFRLMPALVARRLYHDPYPPMPLEHVVRNTPALALEGGKVRVVPKASAADYLPGLSPLDREPVRQAASGGFWQRLFGRRR